MTSPQLRKPLLLGEMPSQAGDRYYMCPLSGSPAARLSVWAGLKREGSRDEGYEAWYWTLTRSFDTMNAQERYAPTFDLAAAQKRWGEYLLRDVPERTPVTVVCLGRNAQRTIGADSRCTCQRLLEGEPHAFGCPAYLGDWFYWREAGLLQYVTIPHPSGRNRLWNEKANKMAAQRVLREALWLVGAAPYPARIEDGRPVGFPRAA